MNTEKLNALKERAYKTAVEHGFHEDVKPDDYYLGLVMSEAGEAINADREGSHADTKKFEDVIKNGQIYRLSYDVYIKDTLEDEIADIVIRLLDFAGLRGYKLVFAVATSETLYVIKKTFVEYGLPGILFRLNGSLCKNNTEMVICVAINFISNCFETITGSDKNLWWFVEQKMKYNELRPKLNGKRY